MFADRFTKVDHAIEPELRRAQQQAPAGSGGANPD